MKNLLPMLIAACFASPLATAQITVAERGQPATYHIVHAADASPSQRHAAEELQHFTEKMTGVTLPIITDAEAIPEHAIVLGNTRHTAKILGQPADLTSLGDDGFRIVSKPPHLLIIGGPTRGTLYGVYELLEQFGGCRWYTTWHSVIPTLDQWTIPEVDQTQVPAFAMREPVWFDLLNGDQAARNKVNGSRMRLKEKHGGKIRFGKGLSVHTFDKLCPPSEFFYEHPEYFSEVDGERIDYLTQLCLTNPDVLKIVTERLLEYIREDPTATLFSVSQNDWLNPCTCSNCKAIDDREGSHAGTLIAFVNQVAEAVEEEFPNVLIETLAYRHTRTPPKTIRPRHNVVPRLCSIECDFSQPIAQSSYKENRRFVQDIRGWSEISKQLYVWDYTTNFRSYLAPFPNVLSLQDNVRFFRDHRVVGLLEQGANQGRHGDFAELKGWLLSRWLWNPELPLEPLLDDFFNGYYGDAAPLVRRYFDELHTFYNDPETKPLRIYYRMSDRTIPDEFYTRAAKLWKEAEAAVEDSPAHLYNVRMGAMPVLYVQLMRMPQIGDLKVWVAEDTAPYEISPERQALAADLLERFKEGSKIRLSEVPAKHDGTLAQWKSWANPSPPPPAQDRAIVEDSLISIGIRGLWGDTVSDPLAHDGSALKVYNTHVEWAAQFPFRSVAFDAGATYRLRMRARVLRKPGHEGQAFWSGIYDPEQKQEYGGCDVTTDQAGDNYRWYDVAEWKPERTHYFWLAPAGSDDRDESSAIKAIYIDQLEIVKVK